MKSEVKQNQHEVQIPKYTHMKFLSEVLLKGHFKMPLSLWGVSTFYVRATGCARSRCANLQGLFCTLLQAARTRRQFCEIAST